MASVMLFLCLLTAAYVAGQPTNPTVRVADGEVLGSWKTTPEGRTYASFQGIPFAKPPVGEYRFREPQKVEPWSSALDATRPHAACAQYEAVSKSVFGSEDCLFLNVFTPNVDAGGSLPVVVFIHGGAFMYGSASNYDPSAMLDRDIVLVTINYRLGPLGFLSTGGEEAPGNAGLKDQVFALRWVQNNIKAFGGNPADVTLTGGSAGASSVHYHYLSPMSKGLFVRGIAWSGSAFSAWTYAVKPAEKARALAAAVGCPTSSSRDLVDCLKKEPAEVVVNAQTTLFDWKLHMFTPFVPTAERPGVSEPFITQYPYQIAQAGGMHKVPLITSVAADEGLYPAAAYLNDPTILPELESRWEELASNILEYNDTLPAALHSSVATKIRQHYFGEKPISKDTLKELVQALGDRLFVGGVGKLAQVHAEHSGQPVYVYRFSHRGSTSLSDLISGTKTNYGVSPADDLIHFLKYKTVDFSTPEDKEMTEVLLDIIYSFITTGVPKLPIADSQWVPVTPGASELNYLDILSPSKVESKSTADFGQKNFWDNLGFIENEKYQESEFNA